LAEDGAEALVLGCAGMTGFAEPLSQALGVPVVDGVAAAVQLAEALAALGLRTSKRGDYARPSPASLEALCQRQPAPSTPFHP
jgi:allantoin racemase